MYKYSIFIFILIQISSCNTKPEQGSDDLFQNHVIDTLNISLDSIAKQSYSVFTINHKTNEFIGFNNTINALDFFSLPDQKFTKRLTLAYDGPNGISNIKGLHYHNPDSIFAYSRGKISIINEIDGQVENVNLYDILQNNNIAFEPAINNYFRLYFDPVSKTIPFFNIYYGEDKGYKENTPLISYLDLKSNSIQTIPYYHTESFSSTNEFGHLNYPTNSRIKNGILFVNQLYSPNTFEVNLNEKTSSPIIKNKENQHQINRNLDNWSIHAVESNFYNQLEKIEGIGFFRFVWEKHDHSTQENGFLQKELVMKLYDENYEMKNEIRLPKNTYGIYTWFVHNNEIFIQTTHPKNVAQKENEFILHKISFPKNLN